MPTAKEYFDPGVKDAFARQSHNNELSDAQDLYERGKASIMYRDGQAYYILRNGKTVPMG